MTLHKNEKEFGPVVDKRVIMVEPNLRSDEDGHYYQNLRVIQEELQSRGIKTAILGCTDSDVTCQQLPTFYPAFSYLPTKGTSVIAKFVSMIALSWHFYRDISKILGSSYRIQLKRYDILYMNTILDTQILGWGCFLWRYSAEFKKLGLKFVFLLKFRPTRRLRLHTALIKIMTWIAFRRLMHPLRDQVVLCTETELLQKEYEDLLNLSVKVLPLPIVQHEVEDHPRNVMLPLTITYLGGNVYYKGFDLLVEAIERLAQEKRRQCRFKLQIQAPHFEGSAQNDLILTAAERLQLLMKGTDMIEVVPESLPTTQYWRLLKETDIFMLPYRSIHYKASTSGVFAEALTLGRIPVVPEGTWMSQELTRLKLGELIFKQENVEDFVRVLGRVIENHLHCREKMIQARKMWRSCHNPQKFVDALLARVGWQTSAVSDQKNLATNVA